MYSYLKFDEMFIDIVKKDTSLNDNIHCSGSSGLVVMEKNGKYYIANCML